VTFKVHKSIASLQTRRYYIARTRATDFLTHLTSSTFPVSENIAIALAIMCFYLVERPQYPHRLRKDLEHIFPDASEVTLSPLALANVAFLDYVLYDALHLAVFFLP
ncbi:hypothetical protein C8Q79DRAFT_1040554, partial [Trametes meyenii]